MTAHRWYCPKCENVCLAPDRPRRDDVRRYCLPCSKSTGRLVERKCLVREMQKAHAAHARQVQTAARRVERDTAREQAKRARAALRAMPIGTLARMRTREAISEAIKRYMSLRAWGDDLSHVKVNLRFGRACVHTSGHAWPYSNRIALTIGTDLADAHATILHELAHIAAPREEHHGATWRSFFLLAASEVIGQRIEANGSASKRDFHDTIARALAEHLYIDRLPSCAASMGCLCAGHARGNPASAPCNPSEEP